MMYHAKATSAIFANHVIKGLTTPGLKKVPTPACEVRQDTIESSIDTEARPNKPGSKQSARGDNSCLADRET